MKVLHINTHCIGGAAIAAIRLHEGLLEQQVDSSFLFLQKNSSGITNSHYYQKKNPKLWDKIKIKFSKKIVFDRIISHLDSRYEGFSHHWGYFIAEKYQLNNYDIINLHLVSGFIDYKEFFSIVNVPVVWTMHDMNAFTGGCHYSWNCNKFEQDCDNCFQLENIERRDLSKYIIKQKGKILNSYGSNVQIVTPSVWLGEQSRKSRLFRNYTHQVIPYGINTRVFAVYKMQEAREKLDLSKEDIVFSFVAQSVKNIRKGIKFLIDALELIETQNNICLNIIGENANYESKRFKINHLGKIKDRSLLNLYYAASSAFIIPALYDNLPNTVIEALVSGTPVLGFPTGGIVDMIEPGVNGLLAENVSTESLKKSIELFIKTRNHYNEQVIRESAIKKYDQAVQAQAYIKLYKKLVYPSSN